MKCEKCGKEIDKVKINMFLYDGSDFETLPNIHEHEHGAVTFKTDANWCGYELSEEEMMEDIRCPHCNEFPFKHKEVQVYDVVKVVCFKSKEQKTSENRCVCCDQIIPEGRQVCPSCEKKTGNIPDSKIVVKPFSFNDKIADVALEDFSLIQSSLSYGACQTIGTALAKLKQMEDKGLNPDILERILTRSEALVDAKEILKQQPKTDWIPCEERLPEYTDDYNVTVGVASELGYFEKVTTLRFERIKGEEPRWVIPNNEVYNVIAWQPLPQPYKKEGAADEGTMVNEQD